MARSVDFYQSAGFERQYGDANSTFASFSVGGQFLNLSVENGNGGGRWGRVIFHVADVDAVYRHLLDRGLDPAFSPRDAHWGERYFHILDPDGHEISFARPIS